MKRLGQRGKDQPFQFIPGGDASVTTFLTEKVRHFGRALFQRFPARLFTHAFDSFKLMSEDPKVTSQLDSEEMQINGNAFVPLWDNRGYQIDQLLKALKEVNGEIVNLPEGLKVMSPEGDVQDLSDADIFSAMYGHQFSHELLSRLQLAAGLLQIARASKTLGIRNMFLGAAEAVIVSERFDGNTEIIPFPMFVEEGKPKAVSTKN